MDQLARTRTQLGAALRRARRAAKLTQAQVAAEIGRRQATVSNLETGAEGANLATLFAVLSALDLELIVRPRGKGGHDQIADLF